MNVQDVKNIEGFEDGKGEKLDIKKKQFDQKNNNIYSSKEDTDNSSIALKALGNISLLGFVAFIPFALIFNQLYWIGSAVCFSMFLSCFIVTSIIERPKNDSGFCFSKNINNYALCNDENLLSDTISQDNKNINSKVIYNNNAYYAGKATNNMSKI